MLNLFQYEKFKVFIGTALFPSVLLTGVLIGYRSTIGLGLEKAELSLYDVFMRAQSVFKPDTLDEQIVVIGITEEDIQALKEYPIHDQTIADAISLIQTYQPRVIALNIFRDIPQGSAEGRAELTTVLKENTNVIAGCLIGSSDQLIAPPPGLPLDRTAFSNLAADADGVLRNIHTSISLASDDTADLEVCRNHPESLDSISFLAAKKFLESEMKTLKTLDTAISIDFENSVLTEDFGGYLRDFSGKKMMINYRSRYSGEQDPDQPLIREINLRTLLSGDANPDWLKDRIVFIGYLSGPDIFEVPKIPLWEYSTKIHAQATSQILAAILDERPLIWSPSNGIENLLILAWGIVGGTSAYFLQRVGIVRLLFQGRKRIPAAMKVVIIWISLILNCFLLVIICVGIYFGTFIFLQGIWLPVAQSTWATLLSAVGTVIVIQTKTLIDLLGAYSRFVPYEYLGFLNQDSFIDVKLGDQVSKEMAVLFSDVRSFTTLSETMTPQENFDFINAYFRQVSPEIRKNGGLIVKYLGDGMMAVFPNGADDAIRAGIAKAQQVQTYNKHRQQKGYKVIAVGIGIHMGYMMVGMVGEVNRMQGDAFSDDVNLAARLEGLTKFYQIPLLISEDLLQKSSEPQLYNLRFLDRVIVKGRQEPITIYEVLDAQPPAAQTLKLKTLSLYEKAQTHYRAGHLSKAEETFQAIMAINPEDTVVKLYLERIQNLRRQGLPTDWTGIWQFSSK